MLAFALALVFLIPASLACLHYLALVAAGLLPRRTPRRAEATHTIAVLIPAHDEEAALSETLRSLDRADYPLHLVRRLVVADNCSDRTAEIARSAGADCVVRRDPLRPGKGHAVAFGLETALAEGADAVLILDADCTVDPELLLRLDAELATGADAVQCSVVSANAGGAGYAAAVGADLDNLMAAGAARLGGSVPLRGTGMLFRAELLRRHPWRVSGPTEDAEYREVLRKAGVPVRFAADRAVHCLPPPDAGALLMQRRRWRSALYVPGRHPFFRLLGSKPLVLAHLLLTTATVPAIAPETSAMIWLAALHLATAATYTPSILRVGRPAGAAELLRSLWLVARLALVALGSFGRRERGWRRTPREPLRSLASSGAAPVSAAAPVPEAGPGGDPRARSRSEPGIAAGLGSARRSKAAGIRHAARESVR